MIITRNGRSSGTDNLGSEEVVVVVVVVVDVVEVAVVVVVVAVVVVVEFVDVVARSDSDEVVD